MSARSTVSAAPWLDLPADLPQPLLPASTSPFSLSALLSKDALNEPPPTSVASKCCAAVKSPAVASPQVDLAPAEDAEEAAPATKAPTPAAVWQARGLERKSSSRHNRQSAGLGGNTRGNGGCGGSVSATGGSPATISLSAVLVSSLGFTAATRLANRAALMLLLPPLLLLVSWPWLILSISVAAALSSATAAERACNTARALNAIKHSGASSSSAQVLPRSCTSRNGPVEPAPTAIDEGAAAAAAAVEGAVETVADVGVSQSAFAAEPEGGKNESAARRGWRRERRSDPRCAVALFISARLAEP